ERSFREEDVDPDVARLVGEAVIDGEAQRVIDLRTVERHGAGRARDLHRRPHRSPLPARKTRRLPDDIDHGARRSRDARTGSHHSVAPGIITIKISAKRYESSSSLWSNPFEGV